MFVETAEMRTSGDIIIDFSFEDTIACGLALLVFCSSIILVKLLALTPSLGFKATMLMAWANNASLATRIMLIVGV